MGIVHIPFISHSSFCAEDILDNSGWRGVWHWVVKVEAFKLWVYERYYTNTTPTNVGRKEGTNAPSFTKDAKRWLYRGEY